jgi:hypothetical protein
MTSVQQLAPANGDQPVSRALAALVLAVLTLLVAIVTLMFLGAAPKVAWPSFAPTPFARALSNTAYSSALLTDNPACAAALERAKASRTLPGDQAIVANTAMLRACKRS